MKLKEKFSSSAKNLKNVRYIAIMAIFIALKIISSSYLHFTVSHNLRVGIGFVLVAIEASILGPSAGMLSGAITDTLGFSRLYSNRYDGQFLLWYFLIWSSN